MAKPFYGVTYFGFLVIQAIWFDKFLPWLPLLWVIIIFFSIDTSFTKKTLNNSLQKTVLFLETKFYFWSFIVLHQYCFNVYEGQRAMLRKNYIISNDQKSKIKESLKRPVF